MSSVSTLTKRFFFKTHYDNFIPCGYRNFHERFKALADSFDQLDNTKVPGHVTFEIEQQISKAKINKVIQYENWNFIRNINLSPMSNKSFIFRLKN